MSTPAIEQYLKVSESKSLDVLFWLLHHRDKNNQVYATLDQVAKECYVTKVTVNRMFQKLYSEGFLTKIRNGHYQIHKV
jgi:Mn-dependent DtxR family transcriptional regulator